MSNQYSNYNNGFTKPWRKLKRGRITTTDNNGVVTNSYFDLAPNAHEPLYKKIQCDTELLIE